MELRDWRIHDVWQSARRITNKKIKIITVKLIFFDNEPKTNYEETLMFKSFLHSQMERSVSQVYRVRFILVQKILTLL